MRKPVYIGIDISKRTLDVAAPGMSENLPNEIDGFRQLLAQTRAFRGRRRFICEATGKYSRNLVSFLHQRNCRVCVVHAAKVRQYAKATGRLAKTDALDAQILVSFGESLQPEPTPKPNPTRVLLMEMVRMRRQLILLQRSAEQRADGYAASFNQSSMQAVIEVIGQQLAVCEENSAKIIANDDCLRMLHAKLREFPCIGDRTATSILGELPELGHINRRKIAALAGVAPFNMDSGNVTGARIQGGRSYVRTVLFMAVFASIRHKVGVGPYYRELRARGKPHRVAMVAAMRKLLITLNAIARDAMLEAGMIIAKRA